MRWCMKTIGKYQILETIGAGGFAVVYKGFDPDIKRLVAIKVCGSNDREVQARFSQEAEIAGQLSHRNITALYEFGVFMQTPYLVEEYLPGADLAQLIRRREPSFLLEKIDILLQISEGLAYAHRKGVVHRDVKPANVRVLDDGRVKILDFGTAKVIGTETELTQTGMTHGTVAYMAPERLCGKPGHASSDIFSFGALAFELFTFTRPFEGETVPAVIEQILEDGAPSLVSRFDECPPALASVVDRALANAAEDRYPTAVELLADLEAFRDEWLTARHPPDSLVADADAAPAAGSESDSSGTEVPGLLARIESLLREGRHDRARWLLEEALEIAPADDHVRRLAADHGLVESSPEPGPAERAPRETTSPRDAGADAGADGAAEGTGEDTGEGDEHEPLTEVIVVKDEEGAAGLEGADERSRRDEVASSIRGLVESGRLIESARALAFADRLFDELADASDLRRCIVDSLRQSVVEIRHEALRQAHRIGLAMRRLDAEDQLDAELAAHLAERAEDLAPGRTSARRLAEQARLRDQPTSPDDRHGEAAASIERLLAAGKIEEAAQALRFALDMIGPFDDAERLSRRIDHERRGR